MQFASEKEDVMFCKECGTQLEDGARFCPECGAKAEPEAEGTGENSVYKDAFEQAKSDIKEGADRAGEQAKEFIGKAEDATKGAFAAAETSMSEAVADVEDTLGNAVGETKTASTANAAGHALPTNRNVVTVVLLSIITCGIYAYYNLYAIARDVNIACADDDENTPGLVVYLLLSFVTCGFYYLYWLYKLGNRLAKNAASYGITIEEDGSHILLWKVLGILICCVGSFYGDYILLKNTNAICEAYNQRNGYISVD